MPKAIFSPGPSYSNPEVRKVAGWVKILDLYKTALDELGYEVFIPKVDPALIDQSSTVSKITTYDLVAAQQLPMDADLFLGPPGYSLAQIMKIGGRGLYYQMTSVAGLHIPMLGPHIFLYGWNNADWWRDAQLAEEYAGLGYHYDLSPSWRWINYQALMLADTVIACSPWVAWSHAKVVGQDKVFITPWGVDYERFKRDTSRPASQTDDILRVLFVGGDPIRKGLRYLVEAVKGIEDVRVVVVGCHCPSICFGNPNVTYLGMVPHDQMPELMGRHDVICIPTLEDGIACSLQEGFAAGLVPIATPEAAEVFTDPMFHHGIEDAGIKVNYRDVGAIRDAIIRLRDDRALLRSMSERAVSLAKLQTWDNTKESLKAVIRGRVG